MMMREIDVGIATAYFDNMHVAEYECGELYKHGISSDCEESAYHALYHSVGSVYDLAYCAAYADFFNGMDSPL